MAAPSPDRLRRQLWRIFLQGCALTFFLCLVAFVLPEKRTGLALGALAGWGDCGLVLWGIGHGMGQTPQKAASHMHLLMFVRILWLLAWVITALRGHWQPALIFFGFLLYNIFLLVRLAREGIGSKIIKRK